MLDEADRKKIQEIIGAMECPKHFRCAQSGFETLCRAVDCGTGNQLQCLEDDPSQCIFAFTFSGSYYCDCPLRLYLYEKLKV